MHYFYLSVCQEVLADRKRVTTKSFLEIQAVDKDTGRNFTCVASNLAAPLGKRTTVTLNIHRKCLYTYFAVLAYCISTRRALMTSQSLSRSSYSHPVYRTSLGSRRRPSQIYLSGHCQPSHYGLQVSVWCGCWSQWWALFILQMHSACVAVLFLYRLDALFIIFCMFWHFCLLIYLKYIYSFYLKKDIFYFS